MDGKLELKVLYEKVGHYFFDWNSFKYRNYWFTYIFFWFDYDGNTLFMGRDVLVTFWNDTGYLTRDENKFVFRDVQFADSTFPYLVDYYYIKEINGTEFLYIVCKDNMMVFDKTRTCILFLSTGNVESNLLIKYMQRHYGLNELNIVSSIDELDAIDRDIYK